MPGDVPFLREMLYEAAEWRTPPAQRPPLDEVLARPRTSLYVAGWGRRGDTGLVAEAGAAPIGAAWYRFFDRSAPGYGFVDAATPELTIGVVETARGRGIGRGLIEGLLAEARRQGLGAVSLSVEEENPALRLYERCGFRRVTRADDAWTMVADLT